MRRMQVRAGTAGVRGTLAAAVKTDGHGACVAEHMAYQQRLGTNRRDGRARAWVSGQTVDWAAVAIAGQ